MPASSTLIANMTTVISNGPSANTTAKAIAAAGPIQDYVGNCNLVLLKLQTASVILAKVITSTDGGDGIKTGLQNVQAALKGTSGPSTTLLADMQTAINTGPSATTSANAIAAAGPIMDYLGMLHIVRRKLQEVNVLVAQIVNATDAGDGSLTTLNNIKTALA